MILSYNIFSLLHYSIFYLIILNYIALYCSVLYCMILYYIVIDSFVITIILYCILLYYKIPYLHIMLLRGSSDLGTQVTCPASLTVILTFRGDCTAVPFCELSHSTSTAFPTLCRKITSTVNARVVTSPQQPCPSFPGLRFCLEAAFRHLQIFR